MEWFGLWHSKCYGTLALTRSKVYDVLGHLYQEIGAANQTTTYSYDNDGNILSTLDANANYTQNSYDAFIWVAVPGRGIGGIDGNGSSTPNAACDE